MRRRVADLLRSAVADDGTRQALARGALVEEGGASGFDAFAGLSVPARKRSRTAKRRAPTRDTAADERRERERALQDELAAAEGISPSAVSQRVRADGLAVIVRCHELLRDLP